MNLIPLTKHKIFFLTLLSLFFSTTLLADTEEDGTVWLNVNAQGQLPKENFNWYAELQPRWREEGAHFDQMIIRPAIFYKTSPQSSLWLGYANVKNHPSGKSAREENRLWQQFLTNFEPVYGISLQSRTRLEERRLEQASDTGYRLRQLVRATKKLTYYPDVSIVAWDEFFVHLNDTDWGANKGFDQNRLFAGAAYTLSSSMIVEAGYLNQYVNTQTVDKMNHVLSTTLYVKF